MLNPIPTGQSDVAGVGLLSVLEGRKDRTETFTFRGFGIVAGHNGR